MLLLLLLLRYIESPYKQGSVRSVRQIEERDVVRVQVLEYNVGKGSILTN